MRLHKPSGPVLGTQQALAYTDSHFHLFPSNDKEPQCRKTAAPFPNSSRLRETLLKPPGDFYLSAPVSFSWRYRVKGNSTHIWRNRLVPLGGFPSPEPTLVLWFLVVPQMTHFSRFPLMILPTLLTLSVPTLHDPCETRWMWHSVRGTLSSLFRTLPRNEAIVTAQMF